MVPCLAFEPAVACVMAAGGVLRALLEIASGPLDDLVIPGAPLFLAFRRESGPRTGVVSGAIPLRRARPIIFGGLVALVPALALITGSVLAIVPGGLVDDAIELLGCNELMGQVEGILVGHPLFTA